jgi:ribose transport system ATP-binding protein
MNSLSDNGLVLKMERIEKSFSGVKVLREVDFELRRGEVHCLLGENGAGKSTLVKILMGVYQKDSGKIVVDGEELDFQSAEEARSAGIAMVFQELSVIPQLTIAENIFLNAEERGRLGFTINDRAVNRNAQELLDRYDLNLNPKERVENLGMGFKQMVEILKALSQRAKILVMDEPTASLTREEEQNLHRTIENLKARGVAIIYITHRLAEVFEVGDRVTILRDGRRIATQAIRDTTIENLVEMMVGTSFKRSKEKKKQEVREGKPEKREILLSVKGLSQKQRVRDISFDLHYGEIVGVTGLIGSGKSEIARALFGIDAITEGELMLGGRKVEIKSTKDAIDLGFALVPESRRKEGLVTIHSVAENIVLPIIDEIAKLQVLNDQRCAAVAVSKVKELNIVTPGVKQKVQFLSGGNQQKVVVGKWLTRIPKVMILDEPTTGVDVNAKQGIWDTVVNLAAAGKSAVLLFSSDLDEVITLSDRILVLFKGQLFTEIMNDPPVEERTLYKAIHGIK